MIFRCEREQGNSDDRRREREIHGSVIAGRGWATSDLSRASDELIEIIGAPIVPGSLNVVLARPIRLSNARATKFDGGRRLLWPAKVSNLDVWLYRWRTAPLHVVEILAPVHLRSHFGLDNDDSLTIRIHEDDVESIHFLSALVWRACWAGQRQRVYTDDDYLSRARTICMRYDATQAKPQHGTFEMATLAFKSVVKRIPIVGPAARKVFGRKAKRALYAYEPLPAARGESATERSLRQLQNVLNYTKTSNSIYSAMAFPAGYHSMTLPEMELRGQRNPAQRFELVPVDFRDKTVLDIGCNQGGMLFEIRDKVKWGVGIDYDSRMINAANRIKAHVGARNLNYYVFNLEKEPLSFIENFLPEQPVDVCFLLSVCMWLSNWQEVIEFGRQVSRAMLFETNGTDQQQNAQITYLGNRYGSVERLAETSDDDPKQKLRMLFYCSGSHR